MTRLADAQFNLARLYDKTGRAGESEALYRQVLALDDFLASRHPGEFGLALVLSSHYYNLGDLRCGQGRPQAALAWYARAITTLDAALRHAPHDALAREYLRNTYLGRADALSRLGRHAEALADCVRGSALDDDPTHADSRERLALVLARAGDHRRAVAEAEALASAGTPATPTTPGYRKYALAAALSQAAQAARADAGLAPAKRTALAERYAARAVELLAQARKAGYFANPHNLTDLYRESDFGSLRPRADFQAVLALLMDQGFPADPFAGP